MKEYTVQQGDNKFKPWPLVPKFQTRPGKLYFEAVFDESCLYSHLSNERDWNKLIGRAFNPVNPHANSALVAWRANKADGIIEIADYWHSGKETIWARKPVLAVYPGEKLSGYIDHSFKRKKGYIRLETDDSGSFDRQQEFKSMSCVTFILKPWFGGTYPAPHEMSLKLMYK